MSYFFLFRNLLSTDAVWCHEGLIIINKGLCSLGRKQDWQDRSKNMRRRKKEADNKNDNSPKSSSPGFNEIPKQIDPRMKETGKGPPSAGEEDLKNKALKISQHQLLNNSQ
ncbi:hypothetical protein MKW92_041573 [Papaver armeniacum]|nr:hypothetical protein MKW92_041573 [Papaver armeniacum]